MLDDLLKYYIDNQSKLVKQYNGKYLAITANGVEGVYDAEDKGYYDAVERFGLGNFLLQLCSPGKESYSINISSPNFIFR